MRITRLGVKRQRFGKAVLAFAPLLLLAACTTAQLGEMANIQSAQGSNQNISSLTSVIANNPRDPESYNVRGSAYGRAGQYREALRDFDQAIALNPNFYQAYA